MSEVGPELLEAAEPPQTQEAAQPQEAPRVMVLGEPIKELPKDLYIPPDALEVILEAFEGPLDLLLYLIRRHNLDILDIPIAQITSQYMAYIEMMRHLRLELAGEYLLMAAMLAEIKSRMLLPRPVEEAQEDDPRAELIRRLQEYERFKKAAQDLDELPRVGRDLHPVGVAPPPLEGSRPLPTVGLDELLAALRQVLERAERLNHHHIQREPLSVRERMGRVLGTIGERGMVAFTELFGYEEGRAGVVVTLLAILELIKEQILDLVQSEPFSPIYVRSKGASSEVQEVAEHG